MIQVTIAGRLTKDAATRTAGQDQVCSFSVATSKKVKGEEKTLYVDCSLWGKRGESLRQYLTKGSPVTVIGELDTRIHDGKTYLQCRVSDIALQGGKKASGDAPAEDAGPAADDSEIPF